MIDLTPLDVRKKRGDFRKQLRGYDAQEVDAFLDLVAERLEDLVKENLTLRERSERLHDQVSSQEGRERAVQDALVTAQQLRDEIRGQARREAEELRQRTERDAKFILKQAESEARRLIHEAEREVEGRRTVLEDLERQRLRFLKTFRQLLQRELDMVEVEQARTPLEDVAVELDLGGGRAEVEEVVEGEAEAAVEALGDIEERPDPDAPVHELAAEDGAPGDDAGSSWDDPDPWPSTVLEDVEGEHRDESEGTSR